MQSCERRIDPIMIITTCTLPRITISVKHGVKLARESLGLEIAKDEMSQNVSMNCGTVVFELLPDIV
jgi:hypothetical protein